MLHGGGPGLLGGARPSRFQSVPLGLQGVLRPVLRCHHCGGGRFCFIGEWEASGRSSWEVPGSSGGFSSCLPS